MSEKDDLERVTPEELAALAEVLQENEQVARTSEEIESGDDRVILRFDLIGATSSPRRSLPVLDLIQDRFVKALEQELERITRMSGDINMETPAHMKFADLYASLEEPCAAIVVEAVGLDTTGMLIVDPPLLMSLLDLLIGGTGSAEDTVESLNARGFSPAELRLISHFTQTIGKAFGRAWNDIAPVSLECIRVESKPRHAAVMDPSASLVVFGVNVGWHETEGKIRIALPLSSLRPLEKRLSSTVVDSQPQKLNPWQGDLEEHIRQTPIEVVAELGRASLTLNRLIDLKAGDVVRLDRDPGGTVDILIEGQPKFEAQPVVHRGNIALRVTNLHPDAEDGINTED